VSEVKDQTREKGWVGERKRRKGGGRGGDQIGSGEREKIKKQKTNNKPKAKAGGKERGESKDRASGERRGAQTGYRASRLARSSQRESARKSG
jgi:hypothetical protein